MQLKKAISEEAEIARKIGATLKSFKEAPGSGTIRSSSPQTFDDPDVWKPLNDTPTQRSTRRQSSAKKSCQDGAWGTLPAKRPRCAKPIGSKSGSAVRSSIAHRNVVSKGKSSSSKGDSVVIFVKQIFCSL
jgi:katanin p60 ATPase-containing subunit A1